MQFRNNSNYDNIRVEEIKKALDDNLIKEFSKINESEISNKLNNYFLYELKEIYF